MTLTEIIKSKFSVEEKNIIFVGRGDSEKKISYKNLYITSLRILGFLQSKGIGSRDEMIIQLKDEEVFIYVFWAGILGGIIPVPISVGNNESHKLKTIKIWKNLNNPYLICDKEQKDDLIKFAGNNKLDIGNILERYIDIGEADNYKGKGDIYNSEPADIAFIQFSSGSTGDPKGVVLRHSNLTANIEGIITATEMNESDSSINWMPLTHDMGLIGSHITPLTLNMDQVHINTLNFIKRPSIWLENASKYRSTILLSPNFGLRYVLMFLNRNTSSDIYDLSNVRIIVNGAEPISIDLCEEFLSRMNKFNLKRSTMLPVYGLAEACVAVTFSKPIQDKIRSCILDRRKMKIGDEVVYLPNMDSKYAAAFADVGYPIKHTNIRIKNFEGKVLSENTIGFIEISGANVTSGYYNMDAKTKEVIGEDGWLNTGDIGFLRNGKLVVIGRYKDVLFLNGQNFYSHDVEKIVMETAGIKLQETEVVVGAVRDYKKQTEKVVAFITYRKNLENFLLIERNIKIGVNLRLGIHISQVVPVKRIPKTTSGKVQRFEMIQCFENGMYDSVLEEINRLKIASPKNSEEIDELEINILSICKEYLTNNEIGVNDNFFEAGINSLTLNQIASRLEELYGDKVKTTDFFANPTIRELARHIKYGNKVKIENPHNNRRRNNFYNKYEEIAIIGIALKTTDIDDLEQYWDCIVNGVEMVKDFPEKRREDLSIYMEMEGYDTKDIKYDRAGYLDEIDNFDYRYFKILPVEAIAMSPAQRLFLEAAAKAVEDAGYGGKGIKGTNTGVYVGYIGDMDGYKYQLMLKSSWDRNTPTGYLSSNIAGRVSYIMDLKGPNLMVDTACSSSLVALDLACDGIRGGSCDQAIVGGIRVKTIPVDDGFKAGFESSDYRTKPFDSKADGTGQGEGVVAVMIKPLGKAIIDKDNIYAVIKGSAVNHDGASIGLSAPNPVAQTGVILDALNRAGVDAGTISYVEAHGTGTPVGDPVEVEGLTNAYARYTNKKQYCSLGSVKANIGHLFEASGLVSVIKCCLMIKHKKLPPLANFITENERINFKDTPFYVTGKATDWIPPEGERRCGISNFGFSGTNAHLILEEFCYEDEIKANNSKRTINIFTLTAKNKESLGMLKDKFVTFIEKSNGINIGDICYTTNVCREHHEIRLAIITDTIEGLLIRLKKFEYRANISEQIYYGIHKKITEPRSIRKITELCEKDLELLSDNGNRLLAELDSINRENQLLRVAQIYTRGANLNFCRLYEDQNVKKISIPTYEFEKLRCWPSFT